MCRKARAIAMAGALSATATLLPSRASAQACCAGSGAITPGRLMLHDDALVGLQSHAGFVHGSYDPYTSSYRANPSGTSEIDLEQDVFGALRVLARGQIALLVPLVETRRATPTSGSEFGGGIGDVNVSARYDATLAGASSYLPGIALLAGLTVPSGRPPDRASGALATDATGIGAYQGTFGLALEQTWGPWLVNATALVSKRSGRQVGSVDSQLATQWQYIAGVAYSFDEEQALALLLSYVTEGDATINGLPSPDSAQSVAQVSVGGVQPLTTRLRLQGNVFLNPPLSGLGQNRPAAAGINLALVFSWS